MIVFHACREERDAKECIFLECCDSCFNFWRVHRYVPVTGLLCGKRFIIRWLFCIISNSTSVWGLSSRWPGFDLRRVHVGLWWTKRYWHMFPASTSVLYCTRSLRFCLMLCIPLCLNESNQWSNGSPNTVVVTMDGPLPHWLLRFSPVSIPPVLHSRKSCMCLWR